MWSKVPWSILLRYGLPALFAVFIVFKVVSSLIDHGKAEVQKEWDASDAKKAAEYAAELVRLNEDRIARERQHRTETDEIRNRIIENEAVYAADLAAVRGKYAVRVRESQDRAQVYERLSDSGATERANLASYAAQLDRSLVEGRQVVGELRATVVQRDRQLVELGSQLQVDRTLVNGPKVD